MNKLRERYDKLSELAKDELFDKLWVALKWRGWAKGHGLAGTFLCDIAAIFRDEQEVEFEEYT